MPNGYFYKSYTIVHLQTLIKISKWALLSLLFVAALLLVFILAWPRLPLPVSLLLLAAIAVLWWLVFKTKKQRLGFIFSLLGGIVLLWGLLQTSFVQNFIISKTTAILSKELKTKVSIGHVDIRFFNRLLLQGLLIEDRKQDTLLYAGEARVNVTDWFFVKDKIAFKNIGLHNTVINMNRTDSVWNYQFILNYFTGSSGGGNKSKPAPIDFKALHLSNIRLNKIDKWIGQSMIAAINKMDVEFDSINFEKKYISIAQIQLQQPGFELSDYDGLRPDKPSVPKPVKPVEKGALKWNNEGWIMRLGKLQMNDGSFKNEKQTERQAYPNQFDGQHIHFKNITGTLSNLLFEKDTLSVAVNLATKERSGFEVKKMESILKFTPEMMEFSQLDLQTNKSRLSNYYAMRYADFNKDMRNYISNVMMDARFKASVLSSDDLAFFAPALSSMKKVIYLEGDARGTVENFTAKNMKLHTGSSFFDGNVSMSGLPDIKSTFIEVKANQFKSNHSDLSDIVPSLKQLRKPSLARLGSITYTGAFTGFINDFVAYGNINTALGNLQADLNMKIPEGNAAPFYSGKIITGGFRLGEFIEDKNFGIVALNGSIKGQGFTLDKLLAQFNGDIQQLHYAGYTYTNAKVDGTLKNKVFKGKLSINDPNVKIKSLDGEFSFAKKEMAFHADADLDYLNLKTFGITKSNLELTGFFHLNFKGNNIDNFLGSARVINATLKNNGRMLSFDSLSLNSFIKDSIKNLQLESNELYANLNGKFTIQELPNAFTSFLSKYYPSYIKAPKGPIKEQDFVFDIRTKYVDEYIQLFDKKLTGFNNAHLKGRIQLGSNELTVNATVPEFGYDGKIFTGVSLDANGNRDTLYANISAQNISLGTNLHFPETVLRARVHNDVSGIQLKTQANKNIDEAELNANIQSFADGVHIHFFPSTFVLNGKRWDLSKDGEITLRKNFPIAAQEIKFTSNEQQLSISTQMEEETSNINLVARLKSVVLQDFLPFVLTKPDLRGKLTGTATVRDPLGTPIISFKGDTDSLSIDGSYVGKTNIEGKLNTQTGVIDYSASSTEPDFNFDATGYYNTKDSTGDKIGVQFNSSRFNLNILKPYLKTIFSNIDGFARGKIKLGNGKTAPQLLGNIQVDTGSLTVAYTKVKYLLQNQVLNFGENSIDLGVLKLKDTLGNTGTASGWLEHHFFDDFTFHNIKVETGKMLLLNTTRADNSQFYGHVIGNAHLSLNGPMSDMKLNIDGAPSSTDSSHIYLPTDAEAREGSSVDYIDFIKFGSEMDRAMSNAESSNITVSLNLNANPACKVDVILDEETGDIIKGWGNGNLKITVGSSEKLSIRGRYVLTGGEYTFNFQTFVKKPFTLNQGSITWNGDPYLANIDIDAEYLAKNVDISNITISNGIQQKSDIIVISHLTGNLMKPEIDFEFKFDEKSEGAKDFFALKRLDDFKNDKNNLFKQVASLLLLNTFISEQDAFLSGQNTFNIAASTMGGIMSSWLTGLFNKELERATKGAIQSYIDINPSINLQSKAAELQANVRAGFKWHLTKRLVAIIAGNYDYNNPYALQYRSGLLTPDISLEWILNNDGSLRVIGFNRTTIDFTSSQRNTTGVKLAYRKEFNKLSDIFKSRRALRAKEEVRIKLPADSSLNK